RRTGAAGGRGAAPAAPRRALGRRPPVLEAGLRGRAGHPGHRRVPGLAGGAEHLRPDADDLRQAADHQGGAVRPDGRAGLLQPPLRPGPLPGAGRRLSFGPGASAGAPTDDETVARLRRTVGAESVIAVVVLAVTALLVNAQPARSALAQPFSTELRSDQVLVDVTVDPAKTGPSALHFYTLSPQGAVQEVQDLTASLTLPSRDVGPLAVPVQRAGPGHFTATGFNIPLSGKWTLEVKVLLSDIDEATVNGTVPVK